MPVSVIHYCVIRKGEIFKDGQSVFKFPDLAFQQFADTVYRNAQINYSKFHKMDNLCKLGFLAADILLNNNELKLELPPYRTGVILSNKNSSLDTDIRYFNMVKSGVASPAVFVYSLPNIVIGEICIRHGIKGENTFFISDRYDIDSQVGYINNLFENHIVDVCLGGWIELTGENYEAFLYVAVTNDKGNIPLPHTSETINKLYQSHND